MDGVPVLEPAGDGLVEFKLAETLRVDARVHLGLHDLNFFGVLGPYGAHELGPHTLPILSPLGLTAFVPKLVDDYLLRR